MSVSEPELLQTRYSPDQIDQGFWFIFGCEGERFCKDLLFDPALPWLLRKACIDSIAELYERFFLFGDCASACWMLWDLLAHDFEAGLRNPQDDPDHARIQDAMFDALCARGVDPEVRTYAEKVLAGEVM